MFCLFVNALYEWNVTNTNSCIHLNVMANKYPCIMANKYPCILVLYAVYCRQALSVTNQSMHRRRDDVKVPERLAVRCLLTRREAALPAVSETTDVQLPFSLLP